MLDEAKDVRADMALDRQRQQATSQRVDEIELRIATLSERRAAACARVEAAPDASVRDLAARANELTSERSGLRERCDEVNRRSGELNQKLSHFRDENEFDLLKTRYHVCSKTPCRRGRPGASPRCSRKRDVCCR